MSRSQDKLELVKGEIRGIDRSLDVKVLPINLANSEKERFAQIFSEDLKDCNLRLWVNNAGKADLKRILEADPSVLQWMLRLNHNSMALLTHHALMKWRKEDSDNQRFGLV